ncbi:MAG: cobalamin biosynthesis protein CobD [Oscillospiraceae bacterium]|nr:cobalamin biosynthesis protein CobD [Oscillospiraceae bacterium]
MVIAQAIALGIGFLLDIIFGNPNIFLHPIRLMGGLISLLEKIIRRIFPKGKAGEVIGGTLMVLIVIALSGGIPFAILFYLYNWNIFAAVAAESIICYFMLSTRSLGKKGSKIYSSLLNQDVNRARKEVSMIVRRDTDSLDDTGITKATVETIAKNTCDGVVAPIIYMAIGGAVLGCVYRAINTMGSIVGCKNEKYLYFGKVAVKLDDIANFIPSRIAARLMIISSYILGFNGKNASYIYKRDSKKYAGPNSARAESVIAGALRIQLAGDAYYFGELYEKPMIGDAISNVTYDNIKQTSRIMYLTAVFTIVILIALKFTVGYLI